MTDHSWAELEKQQKKSLVKLFASDPDRVAKMTIEQSGLRFDVSKTHLDDAMLSQFAKLAEDMHLGDAKSALFSGAAINITEGRAAEHAAERGNGDVQPVAHARALQERMRGLVEAIDAGFMGDIKHILHIGIGGSALGPKLLVDALGRDGARYDVKVVSNIDGAALTEAVKGMDPHKTIAAVASKTFTTTETLLNATSAMEWMRDGGVADPYAQIVALTANPDKALEWGVDESRILPFNESVGGRYSLWCSIGFPVALGLGWAVYEELLEGAAAMDRHFRLATPEKNAPLLAAFADAPDQTAALNRFDDVLRHLPSTVNVFRLLQARPALMQTLVDVLSHAPTLAESLARRGDLLDGLIDASAFDLVGSVEAIVRRLSREEPGDDYQQRLDAVRVRVGEMRFALGVQLIEGTRDPMEVGQALSRVAEAARDREQRRLALAFEVRGRRIQKWRQ